MFPIQTPFDKHKQETNFPIQLKYQNFHVDSLTANTEKSGKNSIERP